MFGIIDKNKKFILLDDNRESLRTTALMLAKEVEVVVPDYDDEGKQIGEHSETKWEHMFTEETADKTINEYTAEDIKVVNNSDKYIKNIDY